MKQVLANSLIHLIMGCWVLNLCPRSSKSHTFILQMPQLPNLKCFYTSMQFISSPFAAYNPDREPHLVFANRLIYDLDCSVFRRYNGTNSNLAMHHSFKKGVIRPNRVENWWDWSKSDQENFEIVRDQHVKVDPDRHYDLVINRT